MRDKDIIKALERCCTEPMTSCKGCPLRDTSKHCIPILTQNALDLIKSLQEKYERTRDNLVAVLDERANNNAEMMKKFADQIKMAFYEEYDELIPSNMADKIDDILKEFVGE